MQPRTTMTIATDISPTTKQIAESACSDSRWAAVVARDATADGQFVYAVKTTGVYCRPGCAARAPRPENVEFHATAAAAEAAGFRACQRCRPGQPTLAAQHATTVAELCRLLASTDGAPAWQALAHRVGLSRYHLHRVFKAVTGVTPGAYAAAQRAARARRDLTQGDSITSAIYQAGYNSSSRFYATSSQVLGMTPSRYRAGGADTEIRFAIGACSLGAVLVAATAVGVCAILLGDDATALAFDLQDRFPRATLVGGDADFERVVAAVVGLVEAPQIGLALPLDVRGTTFQVRVWQALRDIPIGATATYAAIAKRIGAPQAARAVAGACAANLLAIAIPCHRVVRLDGDLGGYRWGVERKRALLDREGEGSGAACPRARVSARNVT